MAPLCSEIVRACLEPRPAREEEIPLEEGIAREEGMDPVDSESVTAERLEGNNGLARMDTQPHDEDPTTPPPARPQMDPEPEIHEARAQDPSTSTSVSQGGGTNDVGYPKANRGLQSDITSTASDRTTTAGAPVCVFRAEEASKAPAGDGLAVSSDAGALA